MKSALGLPISDVVDIIRALAPAFVPGGAVVGGFSLAQIGAIASGVANAAPAAEALFEQLKAAATPDAPTPSAVQWADWNAQADNVHADVQAAVANISAGR